MYDIEEQAAECGGWGRVGSRHPALDMMPGAKGPSLPGEEANVGLVRWDEDSDNLVSGDYSTARGPVLRSEKQEVTKVRFKAGKGADKHHHPEEQTFYVLEGRLRVTVGDDEPYEVGPNEGSFHPSNVPHQVVAVEDTVLISFKNVVDPTGYEATGKLQ
jgi:quercetin dioxygenase-like cupin family protein